MQRRQFQDVFPAVAVLTSEVEFDAIADGASETQTVIASEVRPGDFVLVSGVTDEGVLLSASVASAGEISVTATNVSGTSNTPGVVEVTLVVLRARTT